MILSDLLTDVEATNECYRDLDEAYRAVAGRGDQTEREGWIKFLILDACRTAVRMLERQQSRHGLRAKGGSFQEQVHDEVLLQEALKAVSTLISAISTYGQVEGLTLESLAMTLSSKLASPGTQPTLAGKVSGKNVVIAERRESPLLHSSEIWGEVIENDERKLVVRFDVGGVREEREFYWNEMKLAREELPVGTEVIGLTQLVKAPESGAGLTQEDLRRIGREAEEEVRRLAGTGSAEICRVIAPEEQEAMDRAWAARREREKGGPTAQDETP
jgi:hypothetical protein